MQQNHVPVIRGIVVKNTGVNDLEGVDIHLAFDPDFADGQSLSIERIAAGQSVDLTEIPLHLSTSYLSNLTERIDGRIKLTVTCGGENIYSESYDVGLLAFDQWGGLGILPVMLTSFVTPNHPDVAPILRRASEILEKWTGSGALNEYQTRDPNRVKQQMAAIYEAIAELRIAYCTSPASFEDSGQRVRLYSEILSGRLATCLDMALFYAGCLEAAGIHALLVIVKGHAFAGGWLIQDSFPDSVNDDVSLLTKHSAEGINEIMLVETTCMNAGMELTFDDACRAAGERLRNTDDFQLFIDVTRARSAQIRPLPQRVMREGIFEVEEPEPSERTQDAPSEMGETQIVNHVEHIEVNKQTIWERKLLDLSLRNNLINTRITNSTLQLIPANINEIEDALAAGEEFQIMPKPSDWDNPLMSAGLYQTLNASDPLMDLARSELKQKRLYTYHDREILRNVLTHLYRSSRLAMEENGANTLYLAIGLLKWFETPESTRPRYAPLLLMPIEIIRKTVTKGFIIRSRDEETTLNITLLEMLRQNFGIGIGGLSPLPTDGSGVDVAQVLNVFRRAIMSMAGWDVEEQVVIGNFSFSKFIMWNDIHSNADKLSRNKIVASMINGKLEWQPDDNENEDTDLDESYPAGTVALPIGADSSQFEAICEAVSGKSFILHGPPGTGKSQTITNIIANALYNGKKVLFVAEKMAALQVVQRRLESIGLAPFCLELHSNKTKKSYILEQLKRTTEVVKKKPPQGYAIKARQINSLRTTLNGYVKALHKVWPSGLSLYDCFERYASTDPDGETVNLPKSKLSSLTPDSIADAEMAAASFETICRQCGVMNNHPLQGIELKVYEAAIKDEAEERLPMLVESIDELQKSVARLSELMHYDLRTMSSNQLKVLNEIELTLSETDYIPAEMLAAVGEGNNFSTVYKAKAAYERLKTNFGFLMIYFKESVLRWDFRSWEEMWNESASKWWWPRYIDRRKVKKQLKVYLKSSSFISDEDVERGFTSLHDYYECQSKLEEAGRKVELIIGSLWNIESPDWEKIEKTIDTARNLNGQLVRLTGDIDSASLLREFICRNIAVGYDVFRDLFIPQMHSVTTLTNRVMEQTSSLCELLKAPTLESLPLSKRMEKAREWAENIHLLHDYAVYNAESKKMSALGLKKIVNGVEAGKIPVDGIVDCFNRSLYSSYADYIISSDESGGELKSFHGVMFADKVKKFRSISKELEELTRAELFARLASSLPALRKEASQGSEVGILQRNIRNGGRGTSIRRLFDQIPDLLTRMCPCMLMSPISVAQYIDADKVPFDLVIFDEASQMPTSEAVGAIARGRNLVVVGDPKQMPPTNFFTSTNFDEDNADKEDMENILEDCLALSMPSKHLLWHYRSRHESLIAFSNSKYYDNKLLTFPSPDDLTTKVGWQYVEGEYDRGKSRQNRAEAEAVIGEIRQRLSNPATAGRSIGVVTFNSNQQSLIEDCLTELFSQNPDLEEAATNLDEPIFVKNLENVQGDERDVILFSIGYGPDKTGRIAFNFGPLNRDGGGRRLNVAVSRARYEMKVFSSLRAEDIDLNRTSASGVADLKAFLEYAERGRDCLVAHHNAETVSGDELVESVASRLRTLGHDVRTNIGCSGYRIDIGVVSPDNPERYVLGIIFDGRRYASAGTANDRIVTQDDILRQLGWRLHHVWALDWWENPKKTVESILPVIEEANRAYLEQPEQAVVNLQEHTDRIENEEETKIEADEVVTDEPEEPTTRYAKPYTQYQKVWPYMAYEELIKVENAQMVRDLISEVLSAEAPISEGLLMKRVINALGYTKMSGKVAAYINRILIKARYRTTGKDTVFYWDRGQAPAKYSCYRPVSDREIADIPPEELAVAVRSVVEEQVSLPLETLKKEIAQMFGYSRVGSVVGMRIQQSIDYAIAHYPIILDDDRIRSS